MSGDTEPNLRHLHDLIGPLRIREVGGDCGLGIAASPLAVSIVFGLLASTVLVLLALPALYGVLDDWKWTAK